MFSHQVIRLEVGPDIIGVWRGFDFINSGYECGSASGMCCQQTVVRFSCHHLEVGTRDLLDKIDCKRKWDHQFCLCIKVCTTGEGIDPYRVVLQEGRRHEDLSESPMNTVGHVLFGESEEVVHQLQGGCDRGFNWVDESKEDLEYFCQLRDWDDGERGISCSRLREREHIVEES